LSAWVKKGGDAAAIATYRKYLTAMQLESIKTVKAEAVLVVVKKWIFSPEGGGKFAVKLATFVVTLFGLLLISKFVSSIVRKATLKVTGMSQLLRDFLVKSSKIVTLIFGILIVLIAFGLDMGPLLAVIGGASFIIAFAMQSTLSNFAAGLLVMIYRPSSR
jgi:small conductance mechanosensitive channel